MSPSAPPLRCRPIAEADLQEVAALLDEGFVERSRAYWDRALEQLRTREAPAEYPRFGLMLESEGRCVGVLLQIYVRLVQDGRSVVRCNVSSWYVAPAFRAYAPLLVTRALRHKEVTYLNTSSAPHTRPILLAQGYSRYSKGQFAALPALSGFAPGVRVRRYRPGEASADAAEAALLDAHARLGLTVLVCTRGGERAVFAFLTKALMGSALRAAQLMYCTDGESFTRYAGPLGRWLLTRRGLPIVLLDAKAPVRGLIGRFFKDRAPRYFRGERAPRLNDLAYTETVLFGA